MSSSLPRLDARAIGAAGEHLTCCELLLRGYGVHLATIEGYDLIVDDRRRLYRVQVKATLGPRVVRMRSREERAYQWSVGRRLYQPGARPAHRPYDADAVDLFALVALDLRRIAWLPSHERAMTVNLRVPGDPTPYGATRTFEMLSLDRALEEARRGSGHAEPAGDGDGAAGSASELRAGV